MVIYSIYISAIPQESEAIMIILCFSLVFLGRIAQPPTSRVLFCDGTFYDEFYECFRLDCTIVGMMGDDAGT